MHQISHHFKDNFWPFLKNLREETKAEIKTPVEQPELNAHHALHDKISLDAANIWTQEDCSVAEIMHILRGRDPLVFQRIEMLIVVSIVL